MKLHVCTNCRQSGSAEWFEHLHNCPASVGDPTRDGSGKLESWDRYKARADKFAVAYRNKNGIKDTDILEGIN
mgnify:FL=1